MTLRNWAFKSHDCVHVFKYGQCLNIHKNPNGQRTCIAYAHMCQRCICIIERRCKIRHRQARLSARLHADVRTCIFKLDRSKQILSALA